MSVNPQGLPGFRTARTGIARRIRKSDMGLAYITGGVVVDGTLSGDASNTGNVDVLRPGKVLARVSTSSTKFRNAIIGKTTAAYADNETTLTVSAATATEFARLITATGGNISALFVGPPSAAGTVAETAITVTAASGTTLTIADLNLNKVTDSLLVPASLVDGTWCFVDDNDGVVLTDQNNARIDNTCERPLRAGDIDSSQIIDWPADTSTRAWLVGKLNATAGSGFLFDHLIGD